MGWGIMTPLSSWGDCFEVEGSAGTFSGETAARGQHQRDLNQYTNLRQQRIHCIVNGLLPLNPKLVLQLACRNHGDGFGRCVKHLHLAIHLEE